MIADDHGLVRAGLRSLLQSQSDMEVVGEADSGQQARLLAAHLHPDVLLADISMPDMDGIQMLRFVRQDVPDVRVLMVTMHEDGQLVQDALDAGAHGYIIKRAVESELTTAIRLIASGGSYLHADVRALLPSLRNVTTGVTRARLQDPLSSLEMQLLRLLAEGHTLGQIAAALGMAPAEADAQRRELMGRIGLRTRVDVVRFVREQDAGPGSILH